MLPLSCQENLESSSRLRYYDLRQVVFQYDHYPGMNSSIGYFSWSEREEKGKRVQMYTVQAN